MGDINLAEGTVLREEKMKRRRKEQRFECKQTLIRSELLECQGKGLDI